MRWGCAVISATVGLPVPLCGCHRPAGSYCLSHPRSQQVRPPFSLSFIYLFILFFLFFNPLASFLSSFLFPFPPPFLFLYFYFFFVFYFQRFPRRRAPARSPVMIGPELSKERPLANNRRSVRRVRPTRRGRRAGGREKNRGKGERKENREREGGRERSKKGKQALETDVHLHIMRRHGRDRIFEERPHRQTRPWPLRKNRHDRREKS